MTYLDKRGRVLFVSDGISRGRTWFTAYRLRTGGRQRFKSPVLPLRQTREEAQADLDAHARTHGLESVEVYDGGGH